MRTSAKIKGLFIAALTLFFTANSSAQDAPKPTDPVNYDQGFRLGFGLNGGYVFDDPYDFSIGGDVRLQYDLSKRYSFTLTTGFTNLFVGDEDGVEGKDLGFIPVKAGFKAFFWEDRFYAMGEAGAGFGVTNNDYWEDADAKRTSLILSPSIGWANEYFDLSLRYEHYTDFPSSDNGEINDGTGQIALRIAYGFRL